MRLPPSLGPRDAHVWRVSLGVSDELAQRLEGLLSPDERARSQRFGAARRREFVVGRGALRLILGTYLAASPAALRLRADTGGKPALAPGPWSGQLRFNLSHTADLLLVAVARGREVGIDVERVKPARASSQIVKQLFPAREQELLRSLPRDRRTRAFFTCWTRKEAYLKGTGAGMSVALEKIDVLPAPALPAPWVVYDLPVGPGHAAALAAEGAVSRILLIPLRAAALGRLTSVSPCFAEP